MPPWAWFLPLVVLLLVPSLLTGEGLLIQHDIWASDLLHSHLPFKAFLGESLRDGHFPLWMPDIYSGVPLFAQIEAGSLYPPHLLIFGLFDAYRGLGLAIVFDLLLASYGATLLARRYGADPLAAVLAGLVFAWCGFNVTHGRHLNMHAAAALVPWMVLALEHVLAGEKKGPHLALLIALQLAAGHPQITYITCLLLGARVVVELPGSGFIAAWKQRLSPLVVLGLAAALGAALVAAQLAPVWAFTGESLATVEPTWEQAAIYPFAAVDLWTLVWPAHVGAMETYDYAGGGSTIPWGNYSYSGLLPLLLAPFAMRRARVPVFWAVIGVVAMLLVMGPMTPLYRLSWELLPGMKLFRFPTRFLVVVGLAVSVLGALGLTALTRRIPGKAHLVGALVLGATLADLDYNQLPRFPIDHVSHWSDGSDLAEHMEHGVEDGRVYTSGEYTLWEKGFHRAQGTDPTELRALWAAPIGSSGVFHGLRSPSGYARMVHWRTAAFWQDYNTPLLLERFRTARPSAGTPQISHSFQSLMDRAHVRYLVTDYPLDGWTPVPGPALNLYENPTVLPRAYVVQGWEATDTLQASVDFMFGDGRDETARPAIEGAALSTARTQLVPATLEEQGPNTLVVTVEGPGYLVVADSYDSGWTATVDGEPAELRIANGYQRAVELPDGAAQVVMTYWPAGLSRGLAISTTALFCWLVWLLASLRRTKRGRPLSSS
ncbi:MAG: YfhO family protein [Proteobacteria bacterium]|nr:YfhO family protein [Pseudomonadota bacterium]